ncbi:MAG TPA: PTS sugar transporter subunit IIA [Anaeromyxobacteraceae bacterium]|nr:PTS sugar transporter subunit IIA [Anaeromyxobacteraceae bacterium]
MVGVVLATHGSLAEELLRTAQGICGELAGVRAVAVSAALDMDGARAALAEAIRAVDEGQGVLVLTDMFGGSPANLALTFLDDKLEVVTGVNLPMVVKLATCRDGATSLHDMAQLLTAHGQKNITVASELLRTRARSNPH